MEGSGFERTRAARDGAALVGGRALTSTFCLNSTGASNTMLPSSIFILDRMAAASLCRVAAKQNASGMPAAGSG